MRCGAGREVLWAVAYKGVMWAGRGSDSAAKDCVIEFALLFPLFP